MTRRQRLHDIFQAVVNSGVGATALLSHIEAFTANGKSGIEPWLAEAYTYFVEGGGITCEDELADNNDRLDEVASLLREAVAVLEG